MGVIKSQRTDDDDLAVVEVARWFFKQPQTRKETHKINSGTTEAKPPESQQNQDNNRNDTSTIETRKAATVWDLRVPLRGIAGAGRHGNSADAKADQARRRHPGSYFSQRLLRSPRLDDRAWAPRLCHISPVPALVAVIHFFDPSPHFNLCGGIASSILSGARCAPKNSSSSTRKK